MSSSPQIVLPEAGEVWCNHHLRPLKARWPAGFALAHLGLFYAFLNDKRGLVLCGGDASATPRCMRQVAPVCCWLAEGVAETIVAEALKGKCHGMPTQPKRDGDVGESSSRS